MNIDEEIKSNRRAISHKSDAEILSFRIQEDGKRDDGSRSPLSIACEQELYDRQKKKESDWNSERTAAINALGKPHWSVPLTFWVALAAALISLAAWLFPRDTGIRKEESKSVSAPDPASPPAPAPAIATPSPKDDTDVIPAAQPKP